MMACGFCGKDVPDGTGKSSHNLCIAECYRRKSLNLCERCGAKPVKECYVVCEECLNDHGLPYRGYENCFQE